ncbi:MAG: PAS domain S-box protein, partial [Chloroflexi bacterium]|nr:PAS domain S-box protein [Chloroflexota bacterium]
MQVFVLSANPPVANLVRDALTGLGYIVDLTQSAIAVQERIRTVKYDAIVIDNCPPQINGLHLQRKLRRQGCSIPILILAAQAEESAPGMNDAHNILVKPFTLTELTARLQAILPDLDAAKPVNRPVSHQSTGQPLSNLHRSAKLDGLMELSPHALVIVNEQGQIVLVNWQTEKLLGFKREELINQSLEILMPLRFRNKHVQNRAHYLANPNKQTMASRLDLVILHKNGHEIPAEFDMTPLIGVDGLFFLVAIRDIARRRAEEKKQLHLHRQLRELSVRMRSLREKEHAHISRVIHDQLGQALTGLKMDLSWLQKRLNEDQLQLQAKTNAMSTLISETIEAVRQIATELRPGVLDDIGLIPAIEWQLDVFQKRTDIPCALHSNNDTSSLDAKVETAVFRIFQEALTNIARHAQAMKVDVFLRETATELILTVQDNGRGITDEEINNPKSIGILGMREYSLHYKGTFNIHGTINEGTAVTVRFPLSKQAQT